MSKCYSRWQGRIQRPVNKPMFWEIECGTCGLKLENGKVPNACGLRVYYSRMAAIRMGSINAMLWETRHKLAKAWADYQAYTNNPPEHDPNHSQFRRITRNMQIQKERIRLLMREKHKPGQYAYLVKWEENLRAEAAKQTEP